jgi:hypothetical protein
MLAALKVGPGLVLSDDKGKDRALMSLTKEGPIVYVADGNGNGGGATLNATKDGPKLALYEENGKERAALEASKDVAGLHLFDENGKDRAMLFVTKDTVGLNLRDENRKLRAAMGSGVIRADGTMEISPESSLRLFNSDAHLVWRAP